MVVGMDTRVSTPFSVVVRRGSTKEFECQLPTRNAVSRALVDAALGVE
jgi:hypothetical protein